MKRFFIITGALLLCLAANAKQPQRGYRGFLEWSSSLRGEKFGYLGIDF